MASFIKVKGHVYTFFLYFFVNIRKTDYVQFEMGLRFLCHYVSLAAKAAFFTSLMATVCFLNVVK